MSPVISLLSERESGCTHASIVLLSSTCIVSYLCASVLGHVCISMCVSVGACLHIYVHQFGACLHIYVRQCWGVSAYLCASVLGYVYISMCVSVGACLHIYVRQCRGVSA